MGRVTYVLARMWEQNAQIFVENSNVGEIHENFFDPLTTSKSALGCWPIHLSPFTRGGKGGQQGGGGGAL